MRESRIPVEMVCLHASYMHSCGVTGKNMPEKLDAKVDKAITMIYDRENKELEVTWGGKIAFIPDTNIKAYFVKDQESPSVARKVVAVGKIQAQVSTPQDHVFAGPGAGKTK